MKTPRDIWNAYKSLLKDREYEQWGELWTDDGKFVVAYGRDRASFQEESHAGKDDIVGFFSAADKKIDKDKMKFSDCAIYEDCTIYEEEKGDFLNKKSDDERIFFSVFSTYAL
jgi:hypothetical protein